MPKVLIVDDEPNVCYSLQLGLESDELKIVTAGTARQALMMLPTEMPDAMVVDVRLPDLSGLELFEQIKQFDPRLPVIIVTAFAATSTAIEAMKRGAFDYLLKPVDLHHLREVVAKALALSRMRNVPTVFDKEDPTQEGDRIVGQSAAMQEVYKSIGRFAPQDVPILIFGESGTGKELVARAIYQHSKRVQQPFLVVNCAAMPELQLESELFGHEKAAFPQADRQRVGKFEQANLGTLFIDEIGDMSLRTQAKLLRLLQDQQFERLGGQSTLRSDVRIIAATTHDLPARVSSGTFRSDLLSLLYSARINLPVLRDRSSDIPLLVEYFMRKLSPVLEKSISAIAPEVIAALQAYTWPGNVRELHNAIRYSIIQAVSDVLTLDCLPTGITGRGSLAGSTPQFPSLRNFVRSLSSNATPDLYRRIILEVDRVILEEVLAQVKGNQVHASELLGISRTTLRGKLAALGSPEAKASPDAKSADSAS